MLLAALLLPLALAAPTHPSLDLAAPNAPDGLDHLSDYFNLLAEKVKRYKALDAAPECDPSNAVLPTGASPSPQRPIPPWAKGQRPRRPAESERVTPHS